MSLSYSHLPKSPGVYFFKDEEERILYIGKAKNLFDRVSSYFRPEGLLPKTAAMMALARNLDYIVVESEIDALILESNQIKKHLPKYNIDLRDDKRFPYIEITMKEAMPLVRIKRSEENPQAQYFGPYPTGTEVSKMLQFLRRIFPYASSAHPKGKICFRSHLGLCPCADLSNYKRDLRRLIAFLSGKRKDVQKDLEKEMLLLSKQEKFAEAQDLKQKLERLSWLTASRTNPFEYELNPTLVSERYRTQVDDLQKILGMDRISRIECYDISNTSGTLATSSMVVFVDGQPDKSKYRRFRIRAKNVPNDPLMIGETITRRLNHLEDWGKPDLLVVDGGRTQLTAAKIALAQADCRIPVISLAKREEEIYLQPDLKISLPRTSGALQLVQRMRDEAHRFSRKYHFILRKKKMLS